MYSGPASGVWSNVNPFSAAPAGSLSAADNVVFVAPGVIEPRHGMGAMAASTFGMTGSLADALAFYGTSILIAYDLTKVALRPAGGPFTPFAGTFEPNGANRLRFEAAARSMFFNPIDGVRMYDGSGVTYAGAPAGLNITAVNAAAHGWQLPDTAVAYRYTVCRKDAFGRIIEGAPSGRTVLRNSIVSTFGASGVTRSGGTTVHATTDLPHGLTTGDVVTLTPGEADFAAGSYTITVDNSVQFHYTNAGANVSATLTQSWNITRSAALTIWLPGEGHSGTLFPGVVTLNDFLRVYRSEMSLTAATTPADELFQCYETGYLSATDLSNGYVTFADVAPESSLEVPLYTNPNTGDGSLAANFQPPLSEDFVYWQNQMWFLNTTSRHSVEFALIGTGSPDGLQIGDTITIAFAAAGPELIYTAAAASAGTNFEVSLWSDPGFNIQATAQALVQCINADTGNENIVATYVSSEGGLPGRIRLEALLFDNNVAMSLYGSRATCWTPQLPTFVAPAWLPATSSNNRHAARLMWSKVGQPEAVPVTNALQIDVDNHEGLRVFPLKYRLLVFKSDGIYFVPSGTPVSFQKLSDAVLVGRDSIAKLGDVVYCLTDMGIAEISDSGIGFISIPIDDTLTKLSSTESIARLRARSTACGYRSAKQYLCWLIEQETDGTFSTDNEQAFVYSTVSGVAGSVVSAGIRPGFTRYTFGARVAAVNPNTDTLVVAPTDSNVLWEERKSQTDSDYADLALAVTISSVVGTAVTLADASQVAVGDAISQSLPGAPTATVSAVAGNVLTVPGAAGLVAGAAVLSKAIPCRVVFNELTDGEPAVMKLAQQCSFLFKQNGINTISAEFASEIHPAPLLVPLETPGWGSFPWGEVPWGGFVRTIRRVEPLPVGAANCCQLTVGFSTYQAFAKFGFVGIDVVSRPDTAANRG